MRPHPRSLGWIGTTALAMGGSNQSLFLIAALFVGQGAIPGQGSAAVVLLIVGVILSWAAAPALDRAGITMARPRGRHRGGVFRGIPTVQSGSVWFGRYMLLVGLGSNLWPDGTAFGVGNTTMVPAGYSRRVRGLRLGRVVHRSQSMRNKMGLSASRSDSHGFGLAGIRGRDHPDPFGQRRLAAGDDLRVDVTLPGLVWRSNLNNGRPLSGRICGPRV